MTPLGRTRPTARTNVRRGVLAAALPLFAAVAVACSAAGSTGGGDTSGSPTGGSPVSGSATAGSPTGGNGATVPSSPALPVVTAAWVRPAAQGASTAGYLTIAGSPDRADVLVAASTVDAAAVEIHRTSTDANGMTGMQPIDRLEIPAGGSVRLEPGGAHLMVMGLMRPLAVGDHVELRLRFETGGTVVVRAEVRQG